LNVEVDSMAGGPDQPGPDDVRFDDVPDPDLEALARAMAGKQGDPALDYPGAFVSVRPVQPASWNEPGVPFRYCFETLGAQYASGREHIQSLDEEGLASLWFANVTGEYEVGFAKQGAVPDDGDPAPCEGDIDNDPDEENALMGYTFGGVSWVYMETIRDVATEYQVMFNEVNTFFSAHEIGHQFQLSDRPNDPGVHLMDSADFRWGRDAWRWTEDDIKSIRTKGSP